VTRPMVGASLYRTPAYEPGDERCCWPRCPYPINDEMPEIPMCMTHLLRVGAAVYRRALTRTDALPEGIEAVAAPEPPPERPGEVYYLRVGRLIKIGYTQQFVGRMATYPPDAELLARHAGTREYETGLHRRFAQYLAHRKEWYHPGPDLMEHIEAIVAAAAARGQDHGPIQAAAQRA
jgi:hypothetical protein